MLRPLAITVLTAAMVPAARPAAAADAAAGQMIFSRCKICHSLDAGKKIVGPSLHAIFGRKAGTADNFAYSEAMKSSGIVWNDDTLEKYLRNPHEDVPGNNMAFPGLKNDKEIADLLAYLHQATQ